MLSNRIAAKEYIAVAQHYDSSRQVYQAPKLEQLASATRLFAQAGSATIKPDINFFIDPDFAF